MAALFEARTMREAINHLSARLRMALIEILIRLLEDGTQVGAHHQHRRKLDGAVPGRLQEQVQKSCRSTGCHQLVSDVLRQQVRDEDVVPQRREAQICFHDQRC